MRFETKRERAVIEECAARIIGGVELTVGDVIEFDHRFGDEGPNSYTRCREELDSQQIEKAKELAVRWTPRKSSRPSGTD